MTERERLLLVSKLSVPPWRPHWVPRPRLLHCAGQEAGARLLLCSAPAGFGKTTALIAWADQCRAAGGLVAWCTLDPSDNELARFAAYLVGAFVQADAQLPLAELQSRAGADVEQLLVGLLNLLSRANRPATLVLDDYHLIHAPLVHQAVSMLIEHLPANVQLAIGTRADPPLPLARLRARGLLAELRAADLQFDSGEIAAFFEQRGGPGISADGLALLGAWTEGWAAGLQLAALALPHAPDGHAAIEHFHAHITGSQRHIFSFLADEVFSHQPPEMQDFLLATSVVDDLIPELCDRLLEPRSAERGIQSERAVSRDHSSLVAHGSSFMLEQLEQANLFLVRLDPTRPWYRYHHLFRDFLRHRLQRDQPGRSAELHRRAAYWYAAEGEITQAIQHALAAGDTTYAADLIVRVAWHQFSARGEIATILGWARHFPHERLVEQPLLCSYFGRAAFMAEQGQLTERFFAIAEQGLARSELGDAQLAPIRAKLLIYRAAAASLNGALDRAAAWLALAEPILPREDSVAVAVHALAVGINHYLGGDLAAAYAAFERVEALARPARHSYLAAAAVQLLALVDLAAGQLIAAEQRCTALLARLGDELPAIPDLGLVLVRLAAVAYQRGHLERAKHLLLQGAQVGRRSLGRADREIWPWLVRIATARGDHAELRALLAEDERQSEIDGDVVLAGHRMAARAEGLLALGAVDDAWHWAQRCEQMPGEHLREREALAMAHVLLAQRRPDAALARLRSLVAAAESGGRYGYLIQGLTAQSRALHDLGRQPEALAALRRAVTLAAPAGYRQVFLEEGPVVAALLAVLPETTNDECETSAQEHGPHRSAFDARPLVEPLTEREREVLHRLAQGASNQDIANALVITLGTVKTHLNHILSKLGARNRTEAVAHARARGLL